MKICIKVPGISFEGRNTQTTLWKSFVAAAAELLQEEKKSWHDVYASEMKKTKTDQAAIKRDSNNANRLLRDENKKLEGEVSELTKKWEKTKRELAEAKSESGGIHGNVSKKRKQGSGKSVDGSALFDSMNAVHNVEVEGLRNSQRESQKEIVSLQHKVDKLKDQRIQLQKAYQSNMDDLELYFQQEITDLYDQVRDLTAQNGAATRTIEVLESNNARKKEKIAKLRNAAITTSNEHAAALLLAQRQLETMERTILLLRK